MKKVASKTSERYVAKNVSHENGDLVSSLFRSV